MAWLVVTGANGFIGHNLLLDLLEKKQEDLGFEFDFVLAADLETSLKRPIAQRFPGRDDYGFVLAPSLSEEIRRLSKEKSCPPLAVIHNGACSATTETNPKVFQTLNIESSQSLFRLCSELEIPFLYASSASVYGDGSKGFSDAIEDNAKYSPLNLYGKSKHDFDTWVLQQEERPPCWFGLRYFNVYGPHEEHKGGQASILHWGRRQIESTGSLKLYRSHGEDLADGEQQRDFVSVFDVNAVTLALLRLALTKPELSENGRFVNLGRAQATTWIDMGRALFQALGKQEHIEFVDMPEALRKHYQNFTRSDPKSLTELGLEHRFLTHREAFSKALSQMV